MIIVIFLTGTVTSSGEAGRKTRKVLPSPGWDSTATAPPACLTTP